MHRIPRLLRTAGLLAAAAIFAQAQVPTPSQGINRNFSDINRKILEMAKDFPEAKYGYRPGPDTRSFGELILHISAGNTYASLAGRGDKAKWVEPDPKVIKTKAEIVAVFQKSVDDAMAMLKTVPEDYFSKTVSPWVGIIEHNAEHYGLLVGYYRFNGLVPPESRKTKSE
jgi:DinB superfamily